MNHQSFRSIFAKKTWRVSLTRNASCWLFSMFIINVNTVNNHQFTMFINVDKTSAFSLFFVLSVCLHCLIVSLTVTWFQWRTSDEVISHTTPFYHQISSNIFFKKHQMNDESDVYVIIKNHHFNGIKKKRKKTWTSQGPGRRSTCSDQRKDHKVRPMKFKTSVKGEKNGEKWL